MVDLTPERLQELRRIAEAAVQGDWYICHPNCRQVWVRDDGPLGGWCVAICDTQESGEGFTPEAMDANARHIATFDPPTVLALLDEIERLRREVREWMCDGCNTVYPGPPQPGIWCAQCPRCGGDTAPRDVIERRRLEREIERLRRERDATLDVLGREDIGDKGGDRGWPTRESDGDDSERTHEAPCTD